MRIIGCDLHARQQTIAMLDTFVDEPPSVAQGGNGVVIPACRKRINTNDQYLRLSDDVLPVILRKAFEIAGVSTSK